MTLPTFVAGAVQLNDQLFKLVPPVFCVIRVLPPKVTVLVVVAFVIVTVPACVLLGVRATISKPFFALVVNIPTETV